MHLPKQDPATTSLCKDTWSSGLPQEVPEAEIQRGVCVDQEPLTSQRRCSFIHTSTSQLYLLHGPSDWTNAALGCNYSQTSECQWKAFLLLSSSALFLEYSMDFLFVSCLKYIWEQAGIKISREKKRKENYGMLFLKEKKLPESGLVISDLIY